MPKTCKCGEEFEPINYPGSKIKTKVCVDCLVKKGKQKEKKEWSVQKKKIREKLKTLSDYEAEARAVFQKYRRLKDLSAGLGCVSCPSMECQTWQGGHYLKAEIYSGLIFHEDNVNLQCLRCNHFLDGNPTNYRIGLVKRIGEERVKWLEENKDRLRNYKYTREELLKIKQEYTQKIKLKDYGI